MTIGNLYIRPMGVLMMLVPFVLAILAIWIRSVKPNSRTAGYVSNASRFAHWLFIITVLSLVVTVIAGWIDPHLGFFGYNGLWFLVVLSFLFFFCYYVIAFKPVDADQLEEAQDQGAVLFETAGLAAAGIGTGLSATISWTMKMLARAPIDIVRRSGNTIWYRNANAGGFLGSVGGTLLILVAASVILAFAAMYFLLFVVVLTWLLVVYKFVKNLIYLGGPRG